MKPHIAPHSSLHGNSLLVALVLATGLGIGLASFLGYASNQNRQTMRSQAWNLALPAAEAGVEEAMAHLAQTDPKVDDDLISSGWVKTGKKASLSGREGYYKTRTLSSDSYYEVMIDKANPPIITAAGYYRAPLSTNFVRRIVEATCVATNDIFSYAVLAKKHVHVNGEGGVIDSYDSGDSKKSGTGGKYDSSKAQANGKVGATDGSKNNGEVKIQKKGKIYGSASVGAKGKVTVKDDGTMGSKAWIDGGNKGAQTGTVNKGLILNFPAVKEPFTAAAAPSSGKVDGIDAQYLLGNGNYLLTGNVDLGKPIYVTGNATLYIKGDLKADQKIIVKSGASLKLFLGGGSAFFKDMDVLSSKPEDLVIYGLPKLKKLKIEKSADVQGTIYAPRARVELKGDGEIMGAVVGKCCHIKGKGAVHYDEALARQRLAVYKFVIASWKEI
jgi:hypothetical protein